MNSIKHLVRPNILHLKPYSSARDEYTSKQGVFLDANENPYGVFNRYPDPYQKELKQEIGKVKNIDESQIFLGNGSDEVIDLAFRIFCVPSKDRALQFTPTYGMYKVSADINQVEMVSVDLDSQFQINRNKIIPFLEDLTFKLMFVCSPNNPTGNNINPSHIEFLLKNFNGILILDEAYIDFCPIASLISWINKYPNLIICQTLSKAWGMAGLRLGMAFANPEIIRLFNKVKPPYNISSLNQQEALKTLRGKKKFEKNLNHILDEKERLREFLEKSPNVLKIYPSDSNFFLIETPNAEVYYQQLLKKGVVVRYRGGLVPNTLRITIGNADENNKFMEAFSEISKYEK